MKLLRSLVGLTAVLSVIPYKVESKDQEDGKKSYSLTSLTWKADYTPATGSDEANLNIDLLGGLADTVRTVKSALTQRPATPDPDFTDTTVVKIPRHSAPATVSADPVPPADPSHFSPADIARAKADEKYSDALRFALDFGSVSTALLQRRLSIGYTRAALFLDAMEHDGLISGYNGPQPRKVLFTASEWEEKNP